MANISDYMELWTDGKTICTIVFKNKKYMMCIDEEYYTFNTYLLARTYLYKRCPKAKRKI